MRPIIDKQELLRVGGRQQEKDLNDHKRQALFSCDSEDANTDSSSFRFLHLLFSDLLAMLL